MSLKFKKIQEVNRRGQRKGTLIANNQQYNIVKVMYDVCW